MIEAQMSFNLYKDLKTQVEAFADFKGRAVSCKVRPGTSTSIHDSERSLLIRWVN